MAIVTTPYQLMDKWIVEGKYDEEEGLYERDRKAYRQQRKELYNLFEEDIARVYIVSDHPKKDLLFRLAWDYGHALGIHEVLSYYDEMVELIK